MSRVILSTAQIAIAIDRVVMYGIPAESSRDAIRLTNSSRLSTTKSLYDYYA